jgi:hypothetical protein
MASFCEIAPEVMKDLDAAKRLAGSLDRTSDLMELACASAALATLALDVHLRREGKDNHAAAFLETAEWLQDRLASMVELWRELEQGDGD